MFTYLEIDDLTAKIDRLQAQKLAEEKENGLDILPERQKQQVKATYSESTPCDNRCMNAKGNICVCSCNGTNHSKNFLAWAFEFAPQFYNKWDAILKPLVQERDALIRATEGYWKPERFDEVVVARGRNLNKEGKLFWISDDGKERVGIAIQDQKDPIWDFMNNIRRK